MAGPTKIPSLTIKQRSARWKESSVLKRRLIRFAKKLLNHRAWSKVRDVSVFSCFTGLAYIDVKQLTKENISIGKNGHKWIYTHRQKMEASSRVPLLEITKEIMLYIRTRKGLSQNKLHT